MSLNIALPNLALVEHSIQHRYWQEVYKHEYTGIQQGEPGILYNERNGRW